MTTAKPPARYSAMESARSGDFATPELHHPSGHDPAFRATVGKAERSEVPDHPRRNIEDLALCELSQGGFLLA